MKPELMPKPYWWDGYYPKKGVGTSKLMLSYIIASAKRVCRSRHDYPHNIETRMAGRRACENTILWLHNRDIQPPHDGWDKDWVPQMIEVIKLLNQFKRIIEDDVLPVELAENAMPLLNDTDEGILRTLLRHHAKDRNSRMTQNVIIARACRDDYLGNSIKRNMSKLGKLQLTESIQRPGGHWLTKAGIIAADRL